MASAMGAVVKHARAACMISVATCLVAMIGACTPAPSGDSLPLRIYFADVDQGSATLVVAPSGESMLIDSGDESHAGALISLLQEAGIEQLEYFLATHYHADHVGAIDEIVAAGYKVTRAFLDRGDPRAFGAYVKTLEYLEYERTAALLREQLFPGDRVSLGRGVSLDCLVASGVLPGEPTPVSTDGDENESSVGVMLRYGNFEMFLGGDLTSVVENRLVAAGTLADVDVYVADHHGSDTSSTTGLLDVLKPEVVVISSGSHRLYKHPRKAAMDRLLGTKSVAAVYQTNRNIHEPEAPELIRNSDEAFIADLDSRGGDGSIRLDVYDDHYSVTLLTRDLVRNYSLK